MQDVQAFILSALASCGGQGSGREAAEEVGRSLPAAQSTLTKQKENAPGPGNEAPLTVPGWQVRFQGIQALRQIGSAEADAKPIVG